MANRSARALVVELVADTKDFVKGTQQADDALSDFVKRADTDLDKVGRASKDMADDAGRSFDNIAREAKSSFRKVEQAADDAAHDMRGESFKEAGKESGAEFASNLSETLSSGDFTAIGTDTAAGLVSGFASMPGLGPALAVVAGGAAILFGKIAKDATNAAETVRTVFEQAASDALAKMNETVRGGAFVTFMTQLGGGDVAKGMKKITDQAAAAGVSFQTVRDAFIAGGQPLQNLLDKLNKVEETNDANVKLGRARKNAIAEQGIEAGKLADKLAKQNTLINTGIAQQGELNSLYGADDVAAAVANRTQELKAQKDDLNNMARSQERLNAAQADPRIKDAIDERTRALGRQRTAQEQINAVTPTGRPGTVVGGRRPGD